MNKAEEQANIECLAQVYKAVTGQEKIKQESVEDYAQSIKTYLENIIACMPGNVYWMDKNCVYLGCNDNAARFVGLSSRKESVGMTYEDMERKAGWVVGHTNSWKRDDLEVITTGKPKLNVEEKPVLLPNGKEIFYLTSRVPLFDDKKNVIGVVGISFDITDRKLMQRKLQMIRERAEKAERELLIKINQEATEKLQKEKDVAEKTSRLMEILANSIAHEIRTPLAIVGINADLLAMAPDFIAAKDQEKSTLGKYLENIKYAVRLGSHIVDNILIMLRTMSSGELAENKFQQLSIAEDVKKLLEVYPFLEQEKSLLKVQLGKTKDFIYYGDKILTQNILFNLVKNALQAIKEAEKGEIKITLEEGKAHNVLRFTDTALGISEEFLPKIFEQFETKKMDGAGLGLAFCKMVMQSYGGDFICHSKKGEYAEFVLNFPKVLTC